MVAKLRNGSCDLRKARAPLVDATYFLDLDVSRQGYFGVQNRKIIAEIINSVMDTEWIFLSSSAASGDPRAVRSFAAELRTLFQMSSGIAGPRTLKPAEPEP